MNPAPLKLLTIVCEAHARGPVTDLLRAAGAHGWTLFPVEGEGARGPRPADIPEFANLQIQVVVQPELAGELLRQLARDYFPHYGMIAYTSDVQVVRRDKF